MHSERASLGLRIAALGGLVFLHFPILIIFLYAFNTEDAAFSFPPKGFTLKWIGVAFSRPDVLEAIKLSLQIAAIATLIAMVVGYMSLRGRNRKGLEEDLECRGCGGGFLYHTCATSTCGWCGNRICVTV